MCRCRRRARRPGGPSGTAPGSTARAAARAAGSPGSAPPARGRPRLDGRAPDPPPAAVSGAASRRSSSRPICRVRTTRPADPPAPARATARAPRRSVAAASWSRRSRAAYGPAEQAVEPLQIERARHPQQVAAGPRLDDAVNRAPCAAARRTPAPTSPPRRRTLAPSSSSSVAVGTNVFARRAARRAHTAASPARGRARDRRPTLPSGPRTPKSISRRVRRGGPSSRHEVRTSPS